MARLLIALLLGFAALTTPARAEIAKITKICTADGKTQLCPVFLPTFKTPEGWYLDRNKALEMNVALLVPKGKSFGTAPAVIYSDARPLNAGTNLKQWVANSDEKWKAENGAIISEMTAGDLGAGKHEIVMHRYENKNLKQQALEVIAYFMDKDAEGNNYVVRLVVSGVDEKSVGAARSTFDAMLKSY